MGNITAKSISSNLSDAEKQVVRENIEAAPLASPSLTGTPTAPTPTAGDDSTKLATTAFVKAKSELDSIGVNQTWQDVTASRSAGVTYTNNTGKPIYINLMASVSVKYVVVDGVSVARQSGTASYTNATAIVPSGSTYSLQSGGTFVLWSELR